MFNIRKAFRTVVKTTNPVSVINAFQAGVISIPVVGVPTMDGDEGVLDLIQRQGKDTEGNLLLPKPIKVKADKDATHGCNESHGKVDADSLLHFLASTPEQLETACEAGEETKTPEPARKPRKTREKGERGTDYSALNGQHTEANA